MLITGGAAVNETVKTAIQSIKTQVYETYGMTETITHIAVKKLNKVSVKALGKNVFNILPNITITQDNRECLVIDAPNLSNTKITTNDVVKLHSKSSFEWLGRIDNAINTGGLKLFPEQLEAKLRPNIKQRFFITSMDDKTLGEKVVLIIEGSPYTLESNVFKRLNKNEIPKNIYFISQFSETDSGKIQRSNTLRSLKR